MNRRWRSWSCFTLSDYADPGKSGERFPVKTFLINVIGSFVIGLVAAFTARNLMDERLALFLRVGVCGGFTTFSSFALETEDLMTKGSTGMACLYVICSIVCGVLMVMLAEKIIGIN